MIDQGPKDNGGNGRDQTGRFSVGNAGGPGNPYVKQTAQLRSALLRAVSAGDLEKATAAVLKKAMAGDVICFRELCDRLLGKPSPTELLERIERLELQAAARYERREG